MDGGAGVGRKPMITYTEERGSLVLSSGHDYLLEVSVTDFVIGRWEHLASEYLGFQCLSLL